MSSLNHADGRGPPPRHHWTWGRWGIDFGGRGEGGEEERREGGVERVGGPGKAVSEGTLLVRTTARGNHVHDLDGISSV